MVASFEAVARPLLKLVKRLTGMQTSFITSIDWDKSSQHVVFADSDGHLKEGQETAWKDSLCRLMLDGNMLQTDKLTELAPTHPQVIAGLRSFVAVPVVHKSGVLGTLCAACNRQAPLDEDILGHLLLISEALSQQLFLSNELLQAREQSQKRQREVLSLQELANSDPLTGLLNRRGFEQRWQAAVATAMSDNQPLSVMLIDIDHFKQLNDQHGHEQGDRALLELATTLKQLARKDDMACRMGGDEFVLAALSTDAAGMSALAVRLQDRLLRQAGTANTMTVSIGIACSDQHPLTELLGQADTALYKSKQAGRNRIQVA